MKQTKKCNLVSLGSTVLLVCLKPTPIVIESRFLHPIADDRYDRRQPEHKLQTGALSYTLSSRRTFYLSSQSLRHSFYAETVTIRLQEVEVALFNFIPECFIFVVAAPRSPTGHRSLCTGSAGPGSIYGHYCPWHDFISTTFTFSPKRRIDYLSEDRARASSISALETNPFR